MGYSPIPVLAASLGGQESSAYGTTPSGAVPYAGGFDYEEPVHGPEAPAPVFCQGKTKLGLDCKAYATADGLCIAHSKQARA